MRLILLLILGAIVSCRQAAEKPAGLIAEDKMTLVVWDMMRADQFLTDFVFSRDTSVDKLAESMRLYRRIFEIHQVTQQDFLNSFAYYRNTKGKLKAILDSVSNRPNTAIAPAPRTDSAATGTYPPAGSPPRMRDLKAE